MRSQKVEQTANERMDKQRISRFEIDDVRRILIKLEAAERLRKTPNIVMFQ